MPLRIRLAIHGTRHNRIFHLVAIDQRKRRDAKPTETLGIYDPKLRLGQATKKIEWSVDRIKYWLGVGAIPSKSVVKLLEMGSIIPPDSKYHPKALGPRSTETNAGQETSSIPQTGVPTPPTSSLVYTTSSSLL